MDFASISKLLQADAKKYQAYAEAREAIDALAAKGNLVKEIEGAIVKLQSERSKIEKDVADATQALEEIDNEGKLSKALAEEDAAKIKAKAKADAAEILAAADKKLAETLANVEAAESDLEEIKSDIADSKAIKDKLDSQIDSIKKSLGV